MKKFTKYSAITLLLGLSLVTGGSLLAHGPGFGSFGGPGYGPMGGSGMMQSGYWHMGGPGMMQSGYGRSFGGGPSAYWGTKPEDRLATIKVKLGITPEQEETWTAYEEIMKTHIEKAQAIHDAMQAQRGTGERYPLHQQMFEQRKKVQEAAKTLYDTLDANQQQKAGRLLGPGCRV